MGRMRMDKARQGGAKPAAAKGAARKGAARAAAAGHGEGGILGVPACLMGPRLVYIAVTVVLCVFGLVMIYSASSITAYSSAAFDNDPAYFLKHQALALGVGVVVCIALVLIPYRLFARPVLCWALWGFATVLLVVVDFAGNTLLGADRTLSVAGFALQPSEFAKIGVLLVGAMLMERRHQGLISGTQFVTGLAVSIGVTAILLFKQPDMGTTVILFVGVLALLVLGGIRVGPVVAAVLVLGVFLFAWLVITQDYHLQRIWVWLNPEGYASTDGYQSLQARYALGSGGLFGTGIGLGKQKYDYLPYAYNDFIYAVIGEELGMVGALVVVLLFVALLAAGLAIARYASDTFGSVLAGSLTSMLCFQAFLNMACVVGSLPVTGKALPFLSYGGSSLLSTLVIVGLVVGTSAHTKLDAEAERRRGDFWVVDGGPAAARRMAAQNPRGTQRTLGRFAEGAASGAARVRGAGNKPAAGAGRRQAARISSAKDTGKRQTARVPGTQGGHGGAARVTRIPRASDAHLPGGSQRAGGATGRGRQTGAQRGGTVQGGSRSEGRATPKGRLSYTGSQRRTSTKPSHGSAEKR